VAGIVLRGNTIINYEDPGQPHRGTLQGIGCFDGMFVDWVVENNVIITDHWHGITLLGARDCRIVNNTVLDLNDQSPGPPWVRIGNHKDGTLSTGGVIRNNLTTSISIDDGAEVAEDHNLIIENTDDFFVDAAAMDLHLLKGCAAVDSGSLDLAPVIDIEGVSRPQGEGVDIGAYEYREGVIEEPRPDGEPDGGTDSGAEPGMDAGGDPDTGEDAGIYPGGPSGSVTCGCGNERGKDDCILILVALLSLSGISQRKRKI